MTLAGLATVLLMLLLAKRELDNSGDSRSLGDDVSDKRLVVTASMLEDRHHLREPSSYNAGAKDTWFSKSRRYGTKTRDVMVARAARMVDAGSQALLLGGSRSSFSLNHYRSHSANANKLHMA